MGKRPYKVEMETVLMGWRRMRKRPPRWDEDRDEVCRQEDSTDGMGWDVDKVCGDGEGWERCWWDVMGMGTNNPDAARSLLCNLQPLTWLLSIPSFLLSHPLIFLFIVFCKYLWIKSNKSNFCLLCSALAVHPPPNVVYENVSVDTTTSNNAKSMSKKHW